MVTRLDAPLLIEQRSKVADYVRIFVGDVVG